MICSDPKSVVLQRVDEAQRPTLYAMVDAYLSELGSHRDKAVGPRCASEHPYLSAYWQEAGRHPFFIQQGVRSAGFVLVREVFEEGTIQMSEFYVRPELRRTRVGRAALAELWRRFPGSWELQLHPNNRAAAVFWPRCIAEFCDGDFRVVEVEEEDGRRLQYHFEIAAQGQRGARR